MTDSLMWRIAGGSGDGIDSTSQNFAKALMRSGLHVFTHRHYPSRIRGGHTYVEVRAGAEPIRSRGDGFNFLLALGALNAFIGTAVAGTVWGLFGFGRIRERTTSRAVPLVVRLKRRLL